MKKRGQITIFVVLGLVIVVVIGMIVYMSSISSRKEETFEVLSIERESLEVKEYIVSCLDESLKSAVAYCSGNFPKGGSKCPDYNLDIADRVKEGFCNCIPKCIDFSVFKNIQVEIKGEMRVEAKLSDDKKHVSATMEFPLLVKKGDQESLIGTTESPFIANYFLEESACVPIKLIDGDRARCEAGEEKIVEVLGLILNYTVGDKVAIGDKCIAC